MDENDEGNQLLGRARAGDRGAFDAILERLEPRVRAFVLSRVRAGARLRLDIDEIVQDTLVRAFESLQTFHGHDLPSFARWLMGVARIAVIKAANSPGWKPLPDDAGIASGGASPSKEMRREERFDRLQDSLECLKGDDREVLYLARIKGLSMREIAARMGRSPEAVRKLFGRALLRLRERFGDTESFHLPDRQLGGEGEERDD